MRIHTHTYNTISSYYVLCYVILYYVSIPHVDNLCILV